MNKLLLIIFFIFNSHFLGCMELPDPNELDFQDFLSSFPDPDDREFQNLLKSLPEIKPLDTLSDYQEFPLIPPCDDAPQQPLKKARNPHFLDIIPEEQKPFKCT